MSTRVAEIERECRRVGGAQNLPVNQKKAFVAELRAIKNAAAANFRALKEGYTQIQSSRQSTFAPTPYGDSELLQEMQDEREAGLASQSQQKVQKMRAYVQFGTRVTNLIEAIEPTTTMSKIMSYRKTIAAVGVAILSVATFLLAKRFSLI